MSNIVLYASGLLGQLTIKYLKENQYYPDIITLSKNLLRRKTYGDLSDYKNDFKITYVNSERFDILDLKNNQYKYAVTIDWIKDYFQNCSLPFSVYHSHTSLLPMYRGYGSISYQFLMNVKKSGLTIYEENGIIDGGDILYQEEININYGDTPYNFIDNCSKSICNFLLKLKDNNVFNKIPQDNNKSFYIARTRNKQKVIDFNASAVSVYNFITAYSYPFSNAVFYYNGVKCRANSVIIEKWQGSYGKSGEIISISDYGIEVACGEGSVIIKEYSSEINIKFDVENILN